MKDFSVPINVDRRVQPMPTIDPNLVQTKADLETQAVKFDQNKPRYELIDPEALEEMVKVLTYSAQHKYDDHNWKKGLKVTRLLGAAFRHLFAILRGETMDKETGLHHAAHAMCNCMFLIWTLNNKPECDDRLVNGDNK